MEEKKDSLDSLAIEAISHLATGVGVFDVSNNQVTMVYINDGYYQMIGQPREERSQFFGNKTTYAIKPEDRPGLLKEALDSIAEKRPFSYRFRILSGKGNYIWIGIRANHRPLDSQTERFYASYYNVNAYVEKQNALETYIQEQGKILDNIPGGVSIFSDHDGKIHLDYTNPSFYELHHGSKEYWDKQSDNPVDWLFPDDRILFEEEFRQVKNGEKAKGDVAYRIIGEDGNLYWVNNQFKPAYVKDGIAYYYASFIDLDQLKDAEESVLQAQKMYEDATMTAKLIVWTYDKDNHKIFMMDSGYTAAVCKKLGIPQVLTNVPDSLAAFVEEKDRKAFIQAYKDIDNGAETAEAEFRFQLPTQELPQFEKLSLKRIYNKDGELLSIYCCGQNITDFKLEEEKFKLASSKLDNPNYYGIFRLNLTKDWTGDGKAGKSQMNNVLELQKSGTVDGYFKAFGSIIDDEEIRQDLFKRFQRELLLNEFNRGIENVSIEYPVVHKDHTRHWRLGTLTMMKNPYTGDVEAITYSTDIDKQKNDEFVMNELSQWHFDYVGIIHPEAKTFEFRSRNHNVTYGEIGEQLPYKECLAFVRSQFTQKEEAEAFDKATNLDDIIADLQKNGQRTASYIMTSKNGVKCAELRYHWLEKPGGDILVIRSDLSDSYQKEQARIKELEEAKAKADDANLAKSEFLSRMSHDIRTPLNGIIGMSYLASQQDNPPKTKECLTKIDTSSKYLLSLINDILDLSKAESNKIEFHPEPYPIWEFNAYIDSVIRPLCQSKEQKLVLKQETISTSLVPVCDKLRLNQIIFNILSNAVKYTPEKGTITYTIKCRELTDHSMEITHIIKDDGIGMKDDFQAKLFQPFTQENQNGYNSTQGSGLGLAIVKKLVDSLKGQISVTSKLGQGSTFTVILAFDCVKMKDLKKGEEKKIISKANYKLLKDKRILLCEDNPLNQEITKAILSEKGIQVEAKDNGLAGYDAFNTSPEGYYDAILMDIHMPVMDGYEATKLIRLSAKKEGKSIPIIAMTADAFADDVNKCLQAGMNGHIAKPIDPRQIIAELASYLEK
jgi:signal transduction histidine kinase/CheY-like chemotaxis protein/PAS domain-containing protein